MTSIMEGTQKSLSLLRLLIEALQIIIATILEQSSR